MGYRKIGGGGCSSCGDMGAVATMVDAKNQRAEDESGLDIAAV
ncbi:MAG: hypothetical protein BWY12_02593 [candidate division BRC1 bacterium ADurb.Bin183]|nr:MAG: hypothetical protein BWY12_02593 [candidate division BRC1 bacterium ADurb.Bin183]